MIGEQSMAETGEVQNKQKNVTGKPKPLSIRLLIAIPLALVLVGIGYAIFDPASALAGMTTDSCSGDSKAYVMWEIWLRYLWPVVMLGGSLLPSVLIVMNRRFKWVLISLLAGGAVSILWYLLWIPVLFLSGC
jgi:hypothetical protein